MKDIKDILKTPNEEGSWTQKEIEEHMDKEGIKTLEELVKSAFGPEKKKPVSLKDRIPFGKAANKREQDEKLRKKGLVQYGNKAHGGYVKKYAKGGGVRKVKT